MSKMIKQTSKVFSLILTSIIFTFANCRKERNDKELTLPLTWYSGNNLKIDGYFHYDSDGRSEIYLLYRNGVILYGGAPLLGDVGARESEFQNGSYYSHVNESKTAWGRFIINDSNIKYEKWNTSTGGPLETFIASGAILNDTTFRITAVDHSNGDHYDADKVFMYKKFSPKPDSTNTYTD